MELKLKLNFVGDLSLTARNNGAACLVSDPDNRWHELTSNADLTIANFETCLVDDNCPCDRFVALPLSRSDVISKLGIDVFTLANNHILDCGEDSLNLSISRLHQLGIETVGAGKNIREATAPLILTRAGLRIGIIGTTDASHYRAGKRRAGISPLSLGAMKKSITEIADDVDLVILCIHSDLEFTNYPAPWKVRLSRKLANAGADIIVHHHPHTLQGVEIYRNSLIAYSMGSFIFPIHETVYMNNRDGNVNESAILEASVEFTDCGNKNITYSLIPIIIDSNNMTRFADRIEAASIIQKVSDYSSALAHPNKLRSLYLQLCLQQAKTFALGTYYTLCRAGISGTYKYVLTHLSTRMHRNWMRGLLTLGWF